MEGLEGPDSTTSRKHPAESAGGTTGSGRHDRVRALGLGSLEAEVSACVKLAWVHAERSASFVR